MWVYLPTEDQRCSQRKRCAPSDIQIIQEVCHPTSHKGPRPWRYQEASASSSTLQSSAGTVKTNLLLLLTRTMSFSDVHAVLGRMFFIVICASMISSPWNSLWSRLLATTLQCYYLFDIFQGWYLSFDMHRLDILSLGSLELCSTNFFPCSIQIIVIFCTTSHNSQE